MRDYDDGRPDGANQRLWVEGQLRLHGRYENQTAIYRDGITRLAAIIKVLRDKGWLVETEGEEGKTAIYVLRYDGRTYRHPIPVGTPVMAYGQTIGHVSQATDVRLPINPTYGCRVCGHAITVEREDFGVVTGRCVLTSACLRAGAQSYKRLSS